MTSLSRFNEALQKAIEIDNKLDYEPDDPKVSKDKKPYLGVPFTSKEAFKIKGESLSPSL